MSDLGKTLREILTVQPPSTCISIENSRMCGAPASSIRLGMCERHWLQCRTQEATMKTLPVELDYDNRCAECGEPTIRGINSDFCSLDCEEAYDERHTEDSDPRQP